MAYCAMPASAVSPMWTQPASDMCLGSPAMQPMMLMIPNFAIPALPQAMSPNLQENLADFQAQASPFSRSSFNSSPSTSSPGSLRSSKGPISKLQEFVQSSKLFPLPSSCAVLQWSHENRMSGSSLQFRATTSFILDGVPHHVLGGWWASKKQSQRDAAERALGYFVGVLGQEVLKGAEEKMRQTSNSLAEKESGLQAKPSSSGVGEDDADTHALECFCGDPSMRWNCQWEARDSASAGPDTEALCRAGVEFLYFGVPHVFAGKASRSQAAAKADTVRRVLWYLQCPGYERAFEADQEELKSLANAIPEPLAGAWPPGQVSQDVADVSFGAASPSSTVAPSGSEGDFGLGSPTNSPSGSPGATKNRDQSELLERKTTVMRLQNRLQKILAKQLTPGKSVWCWRYEKNEEDGRFQASVQIELLDKTFTGGWANTHQAAQMEACQKLCAFLEMDVKA